MTPKRELLLSLVSPPPHYCYLCGEEAELGEEGLCSECRKKVRLAVAPAPPPYLDGLTAGLFYEDAVATAFYRFKAKEHIHLAPFFAQFMSIPPEWHGELLVPVPLHPLKEYFRTYNQSALLCQYLSSFYGIPICEPLLKRTRYTFAQKEKSREDRLKNLKGAFTAAKECKDRVIILVDDVVTTGSTLSECARTLKKAGAKRVYGVCAASVIR